jgi:hypothetical protein
MIERMTKNMPITHVEIYWERGNWVMPHRTRKDQSPLDKWNVADKMPMIYMMSMIGFDKMSSIIWKFTSAPKAA